MPHLPPFLGHLAMQVLRLVEQHEYSGMFAFLLLEESGIPLLVPGDGIMIYAGYRASLGNMNFVLAYLIMEAATLIGASCLYYIGMRAGRPLVLRYGRFVHVDEERLGRAEAWLRRHGPLSIILGRLVPVLRLHTSLVAGILRIPYHMFIPFVAVGSSAYILFFEFLGFGLGREALRIVRLIEPYPFFLISATLVVIGVLAIIAWRAREKANAEDNQAPK